MAVHPRDLAILIGAAVAASAIYGAAHLIHQAPPPKGNRLVASPPPVLPGTVAELPAATVPPSPPSVEPVAAGPSPVETAPPKAVSTPKLVSAPLSRLHVKRKARRIARAKADPCVGPLCVLVR